MHLKNKSTKGKKITFSIIVTALTIFLIYILNHIIYLGSTLKEILFSPNSNFYNWRFGKIFYTKKGNGSPVLLIHDLDCTSSDFEWREIIPSLSQEHTVYTLDLLGCGRSDKPKMVYTNYLYVQLVADFIKNIIKQKTDIIITGHASSIAIMSCFMEADLYGNIIIVNPDNFKKMQLIPGTKHKLLKFLLQLPILGTFIYNIAVCKNMIADNFKENYFADPKRVSSRYINAYHEAAHYGKSLPKFMYSSIKCHYTNINFIHALKELNNSIYLVGGEQEKEIDDTIEQYTDINPSIETVTIPGTKHLPQLERPEVFVKTIEIYLVLQRTF